jgi:hypothetical protein
MMNLDYTSTNWVMRSSPILHLEQMQHVKRIENVAQKGLRRRDGNTPRSLSPSSLVHPTLCRSLGLTCFSREATNDMCVPLRDTTLSNSHWLLDINIFEHKLCLPNKSSTEPRFKSISSITKEIKSSNVTRRQDPIVRALA